MSGSFGWYRPWLSDIQASDDLSSKAKAVAAVLAVEERDGCVRRTAGYLGSRASLNEQTVRIALAELEVGEWLTRRRARDHIVITLTPRSGTTPDHGVEIGDHTRSGSGTTPAQIGPHTGARLGD